MTAVFGGSHAVTRGVQRVTEYHSGWCRDSSHFPALEARPVRPDVVAVSPIVCGGQRPGPLLDDGVTREAAPGAPLLWLDRLAPAEGWVHS